jgi:hypothetical protein
MATTIDAMAGAAPTAAPDYGLRADKTKKGLGYFGEIKLPNGQVATEYSVGVNLDGKDVEIPTLVPTLTKKELDMMVKDIIPNGKDVPESIMQKAAEHARIRMKKGKPVFATPNEAPKPKTVLAGEEDL